MLRTFQIELVQVEVIGVTLIILSQQEIHPKMGPFGQNRFQQTKHTPFVMLDKKKTFPPT